MTEGNKHALHKNVFKQQIWEFFCGDLESCLAVSKQKQAGNPLYKGGLNFTACLAIFSVIEMCAGYYKGEETNTDTVVDFLNKYLSKYFGNFKDRNFSKLFYTVFRHGLSHQWAPKGSGIDMNFQDYYFLKRKKVENREIVILNIPVFYKFTRNALEDFERDLDSDENLRRMFEKRYEQIRSGDDKQVELLKIKLT